VSRKNRMTVEIRGLGEDLEYLSERLAAWTGEAT
jgi:hypothetical protein